MKNIPAVCRAPRVKPSKIGFQSIFFYANRVSGPDNRNFLRRQAQKIHRRNKLPVSPHDYLWIWAHFLRHEVPQKTGLSAPIFAPPGQKFRFYPLRFAQRRHLPPGNKPHF
jgi:hypothetical protein